MKAIPKAAKVSKAGRILGKIPTSVYKQSLKMGTFSALIGAEDAILEDLLKKADWMLLNSTRWDSIEG